MIFRNLFLYIFPQLKDPILVSLLFLLRLLRYDSVWVTLLTFSDSSSMAIHRVLSLDSNMNFNDIVRGIERIAPIKPRRPPQNINDKNTTSVDRPNCLPISRGSITFPITKPIRILPATTSRALPGPNCINARRAAGMAETIAPILGI